MSDSQRPDAAADTVIFPVQGPTTQIRVGAACGLFLAVLFGGAGAGGFPHPAAVLLVAGSAGMALMCVVALFRSGRVAVLLTSDRVGRRGMLTESWCDLDTVRLVTTAQTSSVFGGSSESLVLWHEGGKRTLSALFARAGISENDRRRLEEARRNSPVPLRPFVVEVRSLSEQGMKTLSRRIRHTVW
jgi:hypothetical protein